MRDSARLARKHGVRLHTHLAETADEDEYCLAKYGVRPVGLMERCGFVGPGRLVRARHLLQRRRAREARAHGAGIAHCPSSNMRLGSGICRVRDMLDLGMPVSLAVDGSASNDSSDFLGEMRQALLLQRVAPAARRWAPARCCAWQRKPAQRRSASRGSAGSSAGYAADLALFSIDRMEYCGASSSPLPLCCSPATTTRPRSTVCNGIKKVGERRKQSKSFLP